MAVKRESNKIERDNIWEWLECYWLRAYVPITRNQLEQNQLEPLEPCKDQSYLLVNREKKLTGNLQNKWVNYFALSVNSLIVVNRPSWNLQSICLANRHWQIGIPYPSQDSTELYHTIIGTHQLPTSTRNFSKLQNFLISLTIIIIQIVFRFPQESFLHAFYLCSDQGLEILPRKLSLAS